MKKKIARNTAIALLLFNLLFIARLNAADIFIGAGTADISPSLPVALMGQFHLRIAHTAKTPLFANVVALEVREANRSIEQTVFVSCDLVFIPTILKELVQKEVAARLPELNVKKIILSATHTHTSPVLEDSWYKIPQTGVLQAGDYQKFFAKRVADAIIRAWKAREKGSVTWGLTSAAVAHNRRAVYTNGSAVMYGKTDKPEFQNLEGYVDHDVNTLFFWNNNKKLIATSVDVPCPAQEVEGDSTVDADFWHEVRMGLKKRFGSDLCVLGWVGAAGDQSPHLMYRKAADERMIKLAKISRKEAIARRIIAAVEESYQTVKDDSKSNVTLSHKVETLTLPMRSVTEAEYNESKKISDEASAKINADPQSADRLHGLMVWNGDVVKRYEKEKSSGPQTYDTEIHVVRLGDAVICTNQFELFTDFGIRIQARSKALQTFVVQLTGPGTYLPTAKAVGGGGYSAVCQSNLVGPEGGHILVERTIQLINQLWDENK